LASILKKEEEKRRVRKRKKGDQEKNKCSKKILSHKSPSISFKVLKRGFHQWSIVESYMHPFSFLLLVLSTI
jgi:hypothetical protein